jgi:uncharacterized membrane protein
VMTDRGKINLNQLDLLRGLAIVLMVINHSAVSLLDTRLHESGFPAELEFLGGFAPVVFFFTTGFGVGIAKRQVDLQVFASTLMKAALLIVADQFLFWKEGTPFGLDFLSFIAISSVVVTAIGACKRPRMVSGALIGAALLLRFGYGPWLRTHTNLSGTGAWIAGVIPVPNVSYPFAPWIVYPLLGILAAHSYLAAGTAARTLLFRCFGVAGIGALSIAAVMNHAGALFFRWGTMSLAYFVLSIGILSVFILAAWYVAERWPMLARWCSLRGIASLAAVPIHYGLISILVGVGVVSLEPAQMLLAMVGLVASTFVLSSSYARLAKSLMMGHSSRVTWLVLGVTIALCAAVIFLAAGHQAVIVGAFVVGQLAVAAALVARNRTIDLAALPTSAA